MTRNEAEIYCFSVLDLVTFVLRGRLSTRKRRSDAGWHLFLDQKLDSLLRKKNAEYRTFALDDEKPIPPALVGDIVGTSWNG